MASGTIQGKFWLANASIENGWFGFNTSNETPYLRWQYQGHYWQLAFDTSKGELRLATNKSGSWTTLCTWTADS